MQVNLTKAAKSYPNNNPTVNKAKLLSQPYSNALVVELEITKHKVMRNLIDQGSLVASCLSGPFLS